MNEEKQKREGNEVVEGTHFFEVQVKSNEVSKQTVTMKTTIYQATLSAD